MAAAVRMLLLAAFLGGLSSLGVCYVIQSAAAQKSPRWPISLAGIIRTTLAFIAFIGKVERGVSLLLPHYSYYVLVYLRLDAGYLAPCPQDQQQVLYFVVGWFVGDQTPTYGKRPRDPQSYGSHSYIRTASVEHM
jgi:hypothetical protein